MQNTTNELEPILQTGAEAMGSRGVFSALNDVLQTLPAGPMFSRD